MNRRGKRKQFASTTGVLVRTDREKKKQFASTSGILVWTAVYLTGYSGCLTGFYEPLLPPYR